MKREKNILIYCAPLPVTLSVDKYGLLPTVTLCNPISWALLAWRFWCIYSHLPPEEPPVKVDIVRTQGTNDLVFTVSNKQGMLRLWRLGFFGKGTLSRSEPSWKTRTERRLGLGDAADCLQREDITAARRSERKAFKSLRHNMQRLDQIQRLRKLTVEEQEKYNKYVSKTESMKAKRDTESREHSKQEKVKKKDPQAKMEDEDEAKKGLEKEKTESAEKKKEEEEEIGQEIREEDADLIDPKSNTLKSDLETLQLQKTEVFFLQFAFGAVQVVDKTPLLLEDLFYTCLGPLRDPNNKFLIDYAVYHHFRSLGWCARSGIKFGCDMLLYKRGPPMLHADFAVLIVDSSNCGWVEWLDFMALARVIGGVRKTLVLAFVECLDLKEATDILLSRITKDSLKRLFGMYKVTEVLYKRWSPNRTRD